MYRKIIHDITDTTYFDNYVVIVRLSETAGLEFPDRYFSFKYVLRTHRALLRPDLDQCVNKRTS